MNQDLSLALSITLVGMGLVFAAIILLWGLMALLVRLTSKPTEKETVQNLQEQERKRRAAVLAVSIALARQANMLEPHEFPLPPTAQVSPWQAIMRSRIFNKRGPTR